MASSVEVQRLTEKELQLELIYQQLTQLPTGVLVYAIEGPLFFGAVENFERALAQTHTAPRVLIIRLKWVPFMDITGLQTLEEFILKLKKRGVVCLLTGANPRVSAKLEKTGVIDGRGRGGRGAGGQDARARGH